MIDTVHNPDDNEVYRCRWCAACREKFYTVEYETDKDDYFMKQFHHYHRTRKYRMKGYKE